MWTSVVPVNEETRLPSSRSKHASVLHGQHLYLLGGRNGNVPLKDFWRYDIADNKWESLRNARGDGPGCLQEHSMVGYKDTIYVFGGEVGFSNGIETPLWMYNITKNEWRKFKAPKGVVTPKGRRSHTATVFQDSLYIYGGYQDLKGSTSELWAFHFASETWHLVSQGGGAEGGPSPRHRHSAVLHENAMWIFGGMTDLQERSDFWRFDFVSRKWRAVRSKPGPGCLHSHCAVKFLSVMMLFGGERDSQALNEIWRFHFATEFWERLTFPSAQPMPRAQTTAFIVSQFKTRGAVHFMGLPEQDYFGSQPNPEKRCITTRQATESIKDRIEAQGCGGNREESLYEEIDESKFSMKEDTYEFDEPDNCLVDDHDHESSPRQPEDMARKIYDKLPGLVRRQQNFQRMVEPVPAQSSTAGNGGSGNQAFKSKISNLNLTKLSAYSTYSMFSNESTESLNTTATNDPEDKSTTTVDSVSTVELSPTSPASVKLNFAMKKSQSMMSSSSSTPSSNCSVLPRDRTSVPSFTQALIHAEETHSSPEGGGNGLIVDIDGDGGKTEDENSDENIYEVVKEDVTKTFGDGIELQPRGKSLPAASNSAAGVKSSDSSYTFQSYDCSSRSSTLSTTAQNAGTGTGNTGGGLKRTTPLRNPKLVDLEGYQESAATSAYFSGDELSSLSGYESFEGSLSMLNNHSSSANNGTKNGKDVPMEKLSFSNPHYLCPDAKTVGEKKQVEDKNGKSSKNIYGETVIPPPSIASEMKRDESHQSFAAALNSPAESLFSDYQDFHARLRHDLVELNHFKEMAMGNRPKSGIINTNFAGVKLRHPRPSDKDIKNKDGSNGNSSTTPLLGRRKPRPMSSGNVDMLKEKNPSAITMKRSTPSPGLGSGSAQAGASPTLKTAKSEKSKELCLLMYVIGGRVGQVTVFNGPISMWKLDLTKTF